MEGTGWAFPLVADWSYNFSSPFYHGMILQLRSWWLLRAVTALPIYISALTGKVHPGTRMPGFNSLLTQWLLRDPVQAVPLHLCCKVLAQVSRIHNKWQRSVRRCRGEDFVQLHVPQMLILPPQAVLGYKEKLRALGSVLAEEGQMLSCQLPGQWRRGLKALEKNPWHEFLTCVFAGKNKWRDVCGFLAGHKAQRKQVQDGKGLLVVSAAFNPLINAREIQQNSEGLKNKISSSCCLVLQCLSLFPSIFLSPERGGKLLSEFSFKEKYVIWV